MQRITLMKKALASALMLLSFTFGLQSCDLFEDNPVVEQAVETIVQETGASAEEVTALISQVLSTPEVQAAIANGEDVSITVAGGFSTSGETTTITIPQTGSGTTDGANIVLTFEDAVTTSVETPLAFTAETGAGSESGDSNNTLEIAMPASTTPLFITIELPNTTVTLTAPGNGTVYQSIVAKTANETLFIGNKVTVEELQIAGGTVKVQDGGKITTYIYPAGKKITNKEGEETEAITINEQGKVVPSYIMVGNNLVCEIRDKDGSPYFLDNLKVVTDGEKKVANIQFEGDLLNRLTIGSGATASTEQVFAKEVEGEANAKIKTWQTWGVSKYANVELTGWEENEEGNSIIVHPPLDGYITLYKVSLGNGTRLLPELDELAGAFDEAFHPQEGIAHDHLHYTITVKDCDFNLIGINLLTLASPFNMIQIEHVIHHYWQEIMAEPNPIEYLNILLREAITFVINDTEYVPNFAIGADDAHSMTLIPAAAD